MEPKCIIHLTHPEYGSLIKATYSRYDFWQMKRLNKPRDVDDVSWKLAVVKLELDFMQLVMKVRKEKENFNFYPFDKERSMANEVIGQGKNIKVIKKIPYGLLRMVS